MNVTGRDRPRPASRSTSDEDSATGAGESGHDSAAPAPTGTQATEPGTHATDTGPELSRNHGLLGRLSKRLESRGFALRPGALAPAAAQELLLRGQAGEATVLSVRPCAMTTFGVPHGVRRTEPGHRFWVRIQLPGRLPYETRVRQRVDDMDLELMRPGDIVGCRVDPGDRDRLVLYVPSPDEATRVSITKVLSGGRRASATVLAATPVAADYSGNDDPVLRLDLELKAWDEPQPWRVRIVQPVPLNAIELVDLGRRLEVAFFTVDRGASVAVDWAASLDD